MSHLLRLPLELLWPIAESLHPSDLVSLMSVNHYLHTALTTVLHTHATKATLYSCPMHWAALNGHPSLIILLVGLGFTPNIHCCSQHSPLHYATSRSHSTTIRTLVAHGADTEVRDSRGETALHRAAVDGNLISVCALIEAGADVEARTTQWDTPLHCAASSLMRWGACKKDRVRVVRVLLEAGADVLAEGFMGKRASSDAYGETRMVLEEAENIAWGSLNRRD